MHESIRKRKREHWRWRSIIWRKRYDMWCKKTFGIPDLESIKTTAIVTILVIAGIMILNNASTTYAAIDGPCQTLASVTPERAVPSGNCVYRLADPISIHIDKGPVDLYDWQHGTTVSGKTDEEYVTNAFTIPPGSSVHQIGGPTTTNSTATSTNTQPAASQPQQTSATSALDCTNPWTPDPNWVFLPATGDAQHVAYLLVGDASKWQEFSQPDPVNFPYTWVFTTTDQQTCMLNPGWAELDFDLGNGLVKHTVPGFTMVPQTVTIKFDPSQAPTAPAN